MKTATEYTERGKTFKFNDHVCIEMLFGVPDEKRTGRLVQVRKGVGAFGSDVLFIRLRDGSMMAFHNALMRHVGDRSFEDAFYRSNGKEPPVVPNQPVDESDSIEQEYTIRDEHGETGFIIENPKQPASQKQSFAMAIKNNGDVILFP